MKPPIAIVGLGCRFPDAPDVHALWQNILHRHTSFRPIRHGRWDHSLYENLSPRDPLHVTARTQAYLDDIQSFAGPHFRIPPRRGQLMDPQQRLMLEVVREALQDAGLELGGLDKQRTATFMGASVSEYNQLCTVSTRLRQAAQGMFGQPARDEDVARLTDRGLPIRVYTLPGNQLSMVATAVAQFFDLQGPSASVDAACASSLMAVVQAVHYLRGLGPSAGPAPVALAGGVYLAVLPDNLLAFSRIGALAREECRPFDARAEGFVLGEGAGVVVLKRLDDAVRDQDRIYAVIRGVAWNSDGQSDGPMTPNSAGQVRLLEQGFADAGLEAQDFGYLECHGTGTAIGDPAELQALATLMRDRSDRPQLGSIKSNIGHSLTAAGVASLIRATLAVHHRTLPPQAGWDTWHPNLAHFEERFRIEREPRPWDSPARRATVSAFGFGGTNAFAALEQAPEQVLAPALGEPLLFVCSAPTPALFQSYLGELESRLDELPLAAAAFTQTLQRERFAQVCLFTARDHAEARAALRAARELLDHPLPRLSWFPPGLLLGPVPEAGEVIFLLPGQAEQLPLETAGWLPEPGDQAYGVELARRELFLAGWLAERGLVPDLYLGHSLGELVATALEGRIPAPELLEFLTQRSQALEQAPAGGILALRQTRAESQQLARELNLDWAGSNHSRLQLLAGGEIAFEAALTELERRQIPFQVLNRQVPFHSSLLAPFEVDHPLLPKGHASLPVDFQPELARALARQPALWLELGPGDGLCQCVRAEAPGELAFSVSRLEEALLALGLAHALGRPVDLAPLYPTRQRVSLPITPLEREVYWAIAPVVEEPQAVALTFLEAAPCNSLVTDLVAQVGGFARGQIARHHGLSAHLGFDSLMLTELRTHLFSTCGSVPELEFWKSRPTVGQLIDRMGTAAPREQRRIEQFPEVLEVLGRVAEFEGLGWRVPYLHTHDCSGGALTEVDGRSLLHFSGYNYLGLCSHPEVNRAAIEATERWGTSASASRLVSGQRPVHDELEQALASFLGTEACLALVSGHATNISLLDCLVGPGDLVLHDSFIHDSVLQGIRLSQAARLAFPHNDLVRLEAILSEQRSHYRRVLVVVEGVYSMDGDIVDLPTLVRLREQYGLILMVDEAHSIGVLGATGRGLAEHWGVPRDQVDVWMGTLSKALASCGGYVAGSRPLISYLKLTAPGFVYSVGMPPASAAAVLAALNVLQREPERVHRLRQNAALFLEQLQAAGCNTGTSQGTPVIPVFFDSVSRTVEMTAYLHEHGVHVLPILHPAVSETSTRLRFFVTCLHSREQLTNTARLLHEALVPT